MPFSVSISFQQISAAPWTRALNRSILTHHVRTLEVFRVRTPNLLISDVVMPGMTGVELGIGIGRDFPACQVLLFSGQAATAEMLDDASAHGHSFELLAKPVHPV